MYARVNGRYLETFSVSACVNCFKVLNIYRTAAIPILMIVSETLVKSMTTESKFQSVVIKSFGTLEAVRDTAGRHSRWWYLHLHVLQTIHCISIISPVYIRGCRPFSTETEVRPGILFHSEKEEGQDHLSIVHYVNSIQRYNNSLL